MNHRRAVLACVALTLSVVATGCTFVKLQPDAQEIAVLDQKRAQNCEKLGQTKVSVAAAGRGEKYVREDLETLARNSAADMGGDTVAPLSGIKEGKQTYGIYKCIGDE